MVTTKIKSKILHDIKPMLALQVGRSEADGQLAYYLFDVLWLEGYDLTTAPLSERRAVLEKILPANDLLRLSGNFAVTGTEFFDVVEAANVTHQLLEAIGVSSYCKRNMEIYLKVFWGAIPTSPRR